MPKLLSVLLLALFLDPQPRPSPTLQQNRKLPLRNPLPLSTPKVISGGSTPSSTRFTRAALPTATMTASAI